MKDPIQKYFQVGTIQWMTHPPVNYPILDSVIRPPLLNIGMTGLCSAFYKILHTLAKSAGV